MRPSWDEHSYRHVDVVAADRVFADINDAVVNAETRSVAVTHRGVYFAFYDQVPVYTERSDVGGPLCSRCCSL